MTVTETKSRPKTRIKIQGVWCELPPVPSNRKLIQGHDIKPTDQYFRRPDIEAILSAGAWDKAGEPLYTPEQLQLIQDEYRRCKTDGYWFYCNGEAIWLTPLHYFYLVYYTLENGKKPDFRRVDLNWFYFFEAAQRKGYVKGIIRLKKRREGATSQVCCWLLWKAIFFSNTRSGIVSKTGEDAFSAYRDMVLNAWNELSLFFKPKHDKSVSKRIDLKAKKIATTGEDTAVRGSGEGLNSSISYRNTTLTAYDSGRITSLLIDESAKWEEVNIIEYLPKVQKTMMEGSKRVGFTVLPSSISQMNRGGAEFKKLYLSSNQYESGDGRTPTGLYHYFVPAFDGLPGFIGKYGESIINRPSRHQLVWLKQNLTEDMDFTEGDIRLGAKAYLKKIRESITDPTLLAEEIRSNPFDEAEALSDGGKSCYFDAKAIQDQISDILSNPPVIRTGKLVEDEKGIIHFQDNPDGKWKFLEMPPVPIQNDYKISGSLRYPCHHADFKIGVDPFRNTVLSSGSKGSNGAIVIMKAADPLDPTQGSYPIAIYKDRPKLKTSFYREVSMAARFFSAKACIESDVDDFYEYFLSQRLLQYLRNTPPSVIDPLAKDVTKQAKREMKGVKSGDEFARNKELELAQIYFDNHVHKVKFVEILEDAYEYDHQKRTKSDLTIALMMALCDMAGNSYQPKPEQNKLPLSFKSYNLLQSSYN